MASMAERTSTSNLIVNRPDWRWQRLNLEKWILWIVLGIGAIAMIGPFYWMFISSFKTRQVIPFSVTLIPLFNMVADWGWRNNYLALVVPIIFTPFGIFLMRQQISNIPSELIDAARIDGAAEFGIYLRVILPLSTASLAALAIFTFTYQWDNFLWPLVVLDKPDLYTLPLGPAQFRGRSTIEIGPVAAASFVAVLPILVVYIFAQRRFIEGITLTGMK